MERRVMGTVMHGVGVSSIISCDKFENSNRQIVPYLMDGLACFCYAIPILLGLRVDWRWSFLMGNCDAWCGTGEKAEIVSKHYL